MRYVLVVEVLLLIGAMCWLTWPDTPAPVVTTAALAPGGIDWIGAAWYVSKVAMAATPAILVLIFALNVRTYLRRRHEIAMLRAQRAAPEHVQTFSPHWTYAPKWPTQAATQPLLEDVTPLPTLPAVVQLADVRRDTPPGKLALGVTLDNRWITAAPGEMYHALFHGQTRSGKTNSVNSVFVQLHHLAAQGMPIELYAGDRKGEFAQTWDGSPLFPEGIQTETGDIADMLEGILNDPRMGLLARNQLFKRTRAETGRLIPNIDAYEAVTGERLPRMFIFVDEINALMLEARNNDRLKSALMQALQMGASAGYYLLGGAQHLKDSVLGSEGKNQFVTRAHFGAANPHAITMLFGKVDLAQLQPYLDGSIKGRGLLSTAGGDDPVPFQAPLCTEQDILGAIAAVQRPQLAHQAAHQQRTDNTTQHQEHQEHQHTERAPHPYEVSTGGAGVLGTTAERHAIIQRMHQKGFSQNQIVETVFGIKKGSNPTYHAAREEIRHAIAALEEAGV